MQQLSIGEIRGIREYCAEEVRRQGRGPDRIPGMLEAWMQAIELQYAGSDINAKTVQTWAHLVEPTINRLGDWRRVNVMVGGRVCPSVSEVSDLMQRWFSLMPDMTALEAYKEFEFIHPFEDGNGRTGKIILNWINGTLLEPIFPPADIFGYPISNP